MKTTEIVVLGAGYTGLMAALGTARRTRRLGGRVTLVNPSGRFTERLRMHQIASGQDLAEHRIPDLIAGSGIEFVQGWARGLDPERRTVLVDVDGAEREIRYDIAVIALGSVADTVTVPGVDAHAFTLDSPDTAARLAERLAAEPDGTVAVVGGGLTGIEAAAEIAERHPGGEVLLLGRDEPGSMMSAPAREYLGKSLHRLGVRVRAGVEVAEVRPGAVELAGGEVVPAAAVLWTTGFSARPLAREAGLAVDERGRVLVDATLRSVSHPEIYAVGDSAAVRQAWGVIHGTCQSGMPTGAYAGQAIARRLRGRPVKPFRFGYIHQPVSLGRRDAVIQFTHPDDSPRKFFLTGRAAVFYKEMVTSSPPPVYRMSRRVALPASAFVVAAGRSNRGAPSPA
ncbi:FAD-dependent oxidoreductase [Dactylosporangium darangshiense]|uniref:FAD-dependent oxidoreductase n=1 Tax=Dactylosporangium darangshiense TaxID=579108 RepID=A0ABP8DK74_9ACTN